MLKEISALGFEEKGAKEHLLETAACSCYRLAEQRHQVNGTIKSS